MYAQEPDIEELESLDPVLSEDRMTVGNLTESLSLIENAAAWNNSILLNSISAAGCDGAVPEAEMEGRSCRASFQVGAQEKRFHIGQLCND
ncbi:hypothetical protein TNCV_4316741 [Trichonephila clavipes]|nr:hypothetical protein TNCV_4316741 [Trichonephila clavipes]